MSSDSGDDDLTPAVVLDVNDGLANDMLLDMPTFSALDVDGLELPNNNDHRGSTIGALLDTDSLQGDDFFGLDNTDNLANLVQQLDGVELGSPDGFRAPQTPDSLGSNQDVDTTTLGGNAFGDILGGQTSDNDVLALGGGDALALDDNAFGLDNNNVLTLGGGDTLDGGILDNDDLLVSGNNTLSRGLEAPDLGQGNQSGGETGDILGEHGFDNNNLALDHNTTGNNSFGDDDLGAQLLDIQTPRSGEDILGTNTLDGHLSSDGGDPHLGGGSGLTDHVLVGGTLHGDFTFEAVDGLDDSALGHNLALDTNQTIGGNDDILGGGFADEAATLQGETAALGSDIASGEDAALSGSSLDRLLGNAALDSPLELDANSLRRDGDESDVLQDAEPRAGPTPGFDDVLGLGADTSAPNNMAALNTEAPTLGLDFEIDGNIDDVLGGHAKNIGGGDYDSYADVDGDDALDVDDVLGIGTNKNANQGGLLQVALIPHADDDDDDDDDVLGLGLGLAPGIGAGANDDLGLFVEDDDDVLELRGVLSSTPAVSAAAATRHVFSDINLDPSLVNLDMIRLGFNKYDQSAKELLDAESWIKLCAELRVSSEIQLLLMENEGVRDFSTVCEVLVRLVHRPQNKDTTLSKIKLAFEGADTDHDGRINVDGLQLFFTMVTGVQHDTDMVLTELSRNELLPKGKGQGLSEEVVSGITVGFEACCAMLGFSWMLRPSLEVARLQFNVYSSSGYMPVQTLLQLCAHYGALPLPYRAQHLMQKPQIVFSEFADALLQIAPSTLFPTLTLDDLKYYFEMYDRNQNGEISLEELCAVYCEAYGQQIPVQWVTSQLGIADENMDRVVDFNEYCHLMGFRAVDPSIKDIQLPSPKAPQPVAQASGQPPVTERTKGLFDEIMTTSRTGVDSTADLGVLTSVSARAPRLTSRTGALWRDVSDGGKKLQQQKKPPAKQTRKDIDLLSLTSSDSDTTLLPPPRIHNADSRPGTAFSGSTFVSDDYNIPVVRQTPAMPRPEDIPQPVAQRGASAPHLVKITFFSRGAVSDTTGEVFAGHHARILVYASGQLVKKVLVANFTSLPNNGSGSVPLQIPKEVAPSFPLDVQILIYSKDEALVEETYQQLPALGDDVGQLTQENLDRAATAGTNLQQGVVAKVSDGPIKPDTIAAQRAVSALGEPRVTRAGQSLGTQIDSPISPSKKKATGVDDEGMGGDEEMLDVAQQARLEQLLDLKRANDGQRAHFKSEFDHPAAATKVQTPRNTKDTRACLYLVNPRIEQRISLPEDFRELERQKILFRPCRRGMCMYCLIKRETSVNNVVLHMSVEGSRVDSARYLMTARRKPAMHTTQYMIVTAPSIKSKLHQCYLGKVSSNVSETAFTFFDFGQEKFEDHDGSRHEIGALMFRRFFAEADRQRKEMQPGSNEGIGAVLADTAMSGLVTVLPKLTEDDQPTKFRPQYPGDNSIARFAQDRDGFMAFRLKPPTWDPARNGYFQDWGHRIPQSSIKNTVLCLDEVPSEKILQFGRLSDNCFCLDFTFPFSPFQAFCVAIGLMHKNKKNMS